MHRPRGSAAVATVDMLIRRFAIDDGIRGADIACKVTFTFNAEAFLDPSTSPRKRRFWVGQRSYFHQRKPRPFRQVMMQRPSFVSLIRCPAVVNACITRFKICRAVAAVNSTTTAIP
ncbi:hypothetical protein AB2F98_01700 [Escherichia coli]